MVDCWGEKYICTYFYDVYTIGYTTPRVEGISRNVNMYIKKSLYSKKEQKVYCNYSNPLAAAISGT